MNENFFDYRTDDLFVLAILKNAKDGKMSKTTYENVKRFLRTQMNRKTVYVKEKYCKENGFWTEENDEIIFAPFLVFENEIYEFFSQQHEKHFFKFFVFLTQQNATKFRLADFTKKLNYSRIEYFYPKLKYFMFLLEERKLFFFTKISPRVYLIDRFKKPKRILVMKKKKFRAKNNLRFPKGKEDFISFPANENSFFFTKSFDTLLFAWILLQEKDFLTPKEFSSLKSFPNRSKSTNERTIGKMFENGFLEFKENRYLINRNFSPSISLPRTLVENLVRDNHPDVLRQAVEAQMGSSFFPT